MLLRPDETEIPTCEFCAAPYVASADVLASEIYYRHEPMCLASLLALPEWKELSERPASKRRKFIRQVKEMIEKDIAFLIASDEQYLLMTAKVLSKSVPELWAELVAKWEFCYCAGDFGCTSCGIRNCQATHPEKKMCWNCDVILNYMPDPTEVEE